MADWSTEEVELVVADYLAMLENELKGRPYDKSERRRRLLPLLNGRSEGSVEFKHQNISAVLIALGFPYISGYKPRSNFQRLLYDVVAERLRGNLKLIRVAETDADNSVAVPQVNDILGVLTDPPRSRVHKDHVREPSAHYLPLPVNYLERESRNRKLGMAGEEFVINFERARLISLNREPLAAKIEHVARTRGDSEGFDVLSFETSGAERLIEVKTTKYGRETPFFVTRNELRVSEQRSTGYHLYRVFAFRETPLLFTLRGALSSTCSLDASMYIASVA